MGSVSIEPAATGRTRTVGRAACVAVLGLGCAAGLVAWRRSPPPEEAAVRAAVRAGRPEQAGAALDRWLKRTPDAAPPYLWKARIALALRRHADAAAALDRAKTLGADRARLDVLRAIQAAQAGRFPDAEPVLRQTFNDRGEPDPLVDETLARIYLESYDFPRASVAIDRWIRDAPDDPKAHLWRAEMDVRSGDLARATADYREALRLDPHSGPARLGLAEELRKGHQTEEAARLIADYLAAKPDDPAARLCAGRIASERLDDDAAARHFEKALALDPDNADALKDLSGLLLRRGQPEAALARLDRAIALDPFDLDTHYNRGILLTRLGRDADARAEQATAARLRSELNGLLAAQARLVKAPGDVEARLAVTQWMLSHGKAEAGVRWAESVFRIQPNHPRACRLLADHYARVGPSGLANYYRVLGAKD